MLHFVSDIKCIIYGTNRTVRIISHDSDNLPAFRQRFSGHASFWFGNQELEFEHPVIQRPHGTAVILLNSLFY